ncbi:hypothetical protein [Rubrivirga sp.]|uniref:hypothetical protein n=1 Tax=Rubrivirga sp. TaxID=1885344 RepID=UPI003C773CF6
MPYGRAEPPSSMRPVLLLSMLALACAPTTDPALRPLAEAGITRFVDDFTPTDVEREAPSCPEMASGLEVVCTSSLGGTPLEWTATGTLGLEDAGNTVRIDPRGFILEGYALRLVTNRLMDEGMAPSTVCDLEAATPAAPGDTFECDVKDMMTSRTHLVVATVTDDPDSLGMDLRPFPPDRENPFDIDINSVDTSRLSQLQ